MTVNTRAPKLPQSPSFSNRPETFDQDGENWSEALDPWTDSVNNMAGEINTTQTQINASQAAVAQAVSAAETEVTNCRTQVSLAQGHAAKAGEWANKAMNQPVEPGLYSARHWTELAESYVNDILTNPVFSQSSTPLDVSDGIKALVTDTGKAYQADMWLILIDKTEPRRWMKGFINSHDPETGALNITVVVFSGEGTTSDWLITQTNASVGSFSPITIPMTWSNQQYLNMGGF